MKKKLQKVWLRGYEIGRKRYNRFQFRGFNMKYTPRDIIDVLERVEYISGCYAGWDDAQAEDITVSTNW